MAAVDAAFETGNISMAEDLDAVLEILLDDLDHRLSDLDEGGDVLAQLPRFAERTQGKPGVCLNFRHYPRSFPGCLAESTQDLYSRISGRMFSSLFLLTEYAHLRKISHLRGSNPPKCPVLQGDLWKLRPT